MVLGKFGAQPDLACHLTICDLRARHWSVCGKVIPFHGDWQVLGLEGRGSGREDDM